MGKNTVMGVTLRGALFEGMVPVTGSALCIANNPVILKVPCITKYRKSVRYLILGNV